MAGSGSDTAWIVLCRTTGKYLFVGCCEPTATVGAFVQQECDSSICELPHSFAICRQQSFSSWVNAKPGKLHASSGADKTMAAASR
jgi:hypothetical protein